MKSNNKSLKKIATAAALAGTLGLAGVAHAQGLYIGGNVGGSNYKGNNVGGAATDRSGTGAKVYGGYQLTPNIALETGYADLGKFKSNAGQLEADAIYLDAVGKLPLTNSVSALGRVGVASGKTDGRGGAGRNGNAKVGAGLEYAIDTNLALRGEWERYRLDTSNGKANTDMYSVGVRYAF